MSDMDLDFDGPSKVPSRQSRFAPKNSKVKPQPESKPKTETLPSTDSAVSTKKEELKEHITENAVETVIDDVLLDRETTENDLAEEQVAIETDSDQDEIVRVIDVYNNKQFDPDVQLYVTQYPLRPVWRPFELDERCQEVRLDSSTAEMEVDLAIDFDSKNFDRDSVHAATMKKQIAISRGLNGIGLAIVTPAIQSLVADSTNESNRGTAFGWLQLTTNFGSTLGGLISVLLAETSFMGIPGWRIAFHLVGIISVAVGILVRLFASDPRYLDSDGNAKDLPPPQPFQEEVRQLLKEAKEVMKVPSFKLLIAQGISGSFPWSSLSFAPMWLELIGFSHKKTALLWTLFNVAQSLGALFGGIMGDVLSTHLPNAGRIILAQISSGSAVPLAAILLLLLPYDPSTVLLHGLVLFIMGLCVSWNAPATNNPIFAEIVPERARTSIYALDRSFESIISAFAPPLVGILAQHVFGFKPIPEGSTGSEEIVTDRENAASLAKALYTAIGIPIALCCFCYSFLYCTYPRDRHRARLQQIEETGTAPSEERQPLLENDEQRLLSVS